MKRLKTYSNVIFFSNFSLRIFKCKNNFIVACEEMGEQGELEALRQLILAATCVTLGAIEEAVEHLRLTIQLGGNMEDESCIPVFASYELGLILADNTEVIFF